MSRESGCDKATSSGDFRARLGAALLLSGLTHLCAVLRDHTLAVLGAGNIGQSILGGLLRGDDMPADHLRATRRNASALAEISDRFPGVVTMVDNTKAVRGATIVVVSVKPQNAAELFAEIGPHLAPGTLVLTTLAGVTTGTIAAALGESVPVVRAMPNTPALVDEAATALCKGEHATEAHLALARSVFEAVGHVEIVQESLMDAVTGLSGSGPAYVFMMIEALTDAGVKQGLPRTVAAKLSAQTVLGAARLALDTGRHPAILRDEVTTPGGTTIAAVAELERHGLRTMLIDAVATATARSRELGQG